jgi:hypothetical protein
MKRLWLLGVLLHAAGFGQPKIELCDLYKDQIKAIQSKPTGHARDADISELLKPDQHSACVAFALAHGVQNQFTHAFEAARTDKQAGTSAGGGATSSLVSKGVTAKAISLASEYGALTESVNGQVVTVSGALDGVPAGLIRGGLASYCLAGLPRDQQNGCIDKSSLDILRRLSYSVSFDTSRSSQTITGTPVSASNTTNPTPITFNPSGHQISAITGRFEIWNQRDATSTTYFDNWLKRVQDKTNGKTLADAGNALLNAFEQLFSSDWRNTKEYQNWFQGAIPILENATDVEKAWEGLLSDLLAILRATQNMPDLAQEFLHELSNYDLAQDALIAAAADKPVFTFEFANNRPVGEDSNSNFRLIFDKGFRKNWSFTANAAMNIWDRDQSKPSVKVSRLRDVQVGAEIDYKLGKLGKLIDAASLDGSYYFQNQHSAILLNVDPSQPLPGITFSGLPSGAATVLASTGNIQIGQLKLVLGTGSSIRVPLAFSYSNRSELVPKPNWRAQVGISYDFDSLFSK